MITEEQLAAAKGWDRVHALRAAAQQLYDHCTHAYPFYATRMRARGMRAAATRLERRLQNLTAK